MQAGLLNEVSRVVGMRVNHRSQSIGAEGKAAAGINPRRGSYGRKRATFNTMLIFTLLFPILEVSSNVGAIPVGTTILGSLMLLIWIIQSARTGNIRILRKSSWVIGLGVLGAISVIWSLDPKNTLSSMGSFVLSVMLYFVVVDVVRDPKRIVKVMSAYALGTAIMVADALVRAFVLKTSHLGYSNRFSATGTDPNSLAVMVAASILAALVWTQRGRLGSIRWVLYATFALVAIVLTASRTGLAAMAIGLIFVGLSRGAKRVKVLGASILATLAATFPIIVRYLPEGPLDRLSSPIGQNLSGVSTLLYGSRGDAWRGAWVSFRAHPWTGVGLGSGAMSAFHETGTFLQAHNLFLWAASELGIVGLALVIGTWFTHARSLWRARAKDRFLWTVLVAALACVFVGSLGLNWEARKPIYLFLGLAASFGALEKRPTTLKSSACITRRTSLQCVQRSKVQQPCVRP